MKAIPIEYIEELISALQDCLNDSEIPQDKKMVNELYCNSRINAYKDLIKYWLEDSNTKRRYADDPE